MNALARAAVGYATRGYEVFPLRGKAPLVERGFYSATANVEQVQQWWTEYPDANIGLRPPDGTLIIDVDPRNGGKLEELGDYPRTRTAVTGSGGWHVWFRASGRFRGTLAGAEGIDLKKPNSYVVAPPSIHPETGQPYYWEIGHPITALPEHLHQRVVVPNRPKHQQGSGKPLTDKQLVGIINRMASTLTERNNVLYWAAIKLHEHNASEDAFADLALAAAGTGLDDAEIDRTIASAAKAVA